MSISSRQLTALIEQELTTIDDTRVIDLIRSLLIEPKKEPRAWEWDKLQPKYLCWSVLEDRKHDTGIAYSEFGFGPENPWGLVFINGPKGELTFGQDPGWCKSFLDAFFESRIPTTLPIWRVYKRNESLPRGAKGIPITPEGEGDATWEKVLKLREEDPSADYV